MTQFMSSNNPRGTVVEARRGDAQPREQGQAVKRDAPEQYTQNDRDSDGVQVDDHVVGSPFLERTCVGRLPQDKLEQRIESQKHDQRRSHPIPTKGQASQRETRCEQTPEVGNPGPTVAHQPKSHACDL